MCLKCWDVVCSSARAGRGEVPSKHIIGAKITSKSKQLVMMPEDHIMLLFQQNLCTMFFLVSPLHLGTS